MRDVRVGVLEESSLRNHVLARVLRLFSVPLFRVGAPFQRERLQAVVTKGKYEKRVATRVNGKILSGLPVA